uniref:Lipocalin n=1 Tax=Rhipicephalus appendiculatus TaxID=34631 RepID=A0A131YV44_RHIAP
MFFLTVIAVAVTFLLFNTDAETLLVDEKELLNDGILPIVGVFKTTERLWFYQQNMSSSLSNQCSMSQPCRVEETRCIVFMKHNITDNDIYFLKERKRTRGNNWTSSELHGTFLHDGNLGSMEVNYTGNPPRPYGNMTLVYRDTNCSVFLAMQRLRPGIHTDYPNDTEPWFQESAVLIYTEPNCSIVFMTPTRTGYPVCTMLIPDSAVDQGPTTNCSDRFNATCEGVPFLFYNETCKTKWMWTRLL